MASDNTDQMHEDNATAVDSTTNEESHSNMLEHERGGWSLGKDRRWKLIWPPVQVGGGPVGGGWRSPGVQEGLQRDRKRGGPVQGE